ncbi:MAG: hypothetical protein K8R85_14670, partial [Bacteroidetes bacterium]|nr:hypothetical protein [Bacteroidota bacterium]
MKKLFLVLFAFFYLTLVKGQQFSFQMKFADAVGNTDSIIMGYDINATDTIDALFGEINIIGLPLDTSLDVRISNEWYYRNYLNTNGTYQTKKQIIYKNCTNFWYSVQSIDILTKHWPVTMTWDSTLFMDSCRNA